MISNWYYLLISLPITVFIYNVYLSALSMDINQHLILLGLLYLILTLDLIADSTFRRNFILLLFTAVGESGRTILYFFMAIVLLTGPIHDLYHNIIILVHKMQQQQQNRTSVGPGFRQEMYQIIESHIDGHLQASAVRPLCNTANDWNSLVSGSGIDICGRNQTHRVVAGSAEFETFLFSLFQFRTYYVIQRAVAVLCLLFCTLQLVKVSRRYRFDMFFHNNFVTRTLQTLDNEDREPTEAKEKEDGTETSGDDLSGSSLLGEEDPQRVFKRTLPLTKLETRQYISVDEFRYLLTEVWHITQRLLKFIWISFLFVAIAYLDQTIVQIIKDYDPQFKVSSSSSYSYFGTSKFIRLCIASFYLFIVLVCVICEPIASRLHEQLLESFYPRVGERRARILMLAIKLRRKSFVEINRLNIHLRYNKVGTVWTALRSFVEDTSLADCLGRPSGLFCSICEREAFVPKSAQRCSTYSCPCVYCVECYEQIRYICLYCNRRYDETVVVHIHPHTGRNASE